MLKGSLTVLLAVSAAVVPGFAEAQVGVPIPQELVALARHNLQFGTVLPGIPVYVRTDHADRAGLFEIRGPDYASVRIDFVLPPEMRSDDLQAALPLAFGAGDGAATNGELMPWTPFDPNGPLVASLGALGQLWIRLGGTVFPSQQQRGGNYHATITLTVSNLGS